MFTGSGMPMRFADLDGSLIDAYQATTQMTDESGRPILLRLTSLNNATGTTGIMAFHSEHAYQMTCAVSGSQII